MQLQTQQNRLVEWQIAIDGHWNDPFNDVELEAFVTAPDGTTLKVPAFWTGGNTWGVRYASPATGEHTWEARTADGVGVTFLRGEGGTISISPDDGDNPLYRHGPIRVAAGGRTFEHADGTPFLWLADTWWMGLCQRLRWPDEFRELTRHRVEQGFNVVQVVAGLYPDMDWRDPRGASEAGYPWTEDFAQVNPAWFDLADQRILHLVESGIVPCIVGCWGFFLRLMGEERLQKHWRYLIARYGALPVTWCAAGEVKLPFYLVEAEKKEEASARQREAWARLLKHIREADPFRRPVTAHPGGGSASHIEIADHGLLDYDMLQAGHGDRNREKTIELVQASLSQEKRMPVINSEVGYECIAAGNHREHQAYFFWASILCGAAGHSYGANGIWQLNRQDEPYGASPHGGCWGGLPWDEAAALPGGAAVARSKVFLETLPWQRCEPHPEWVDPHASPDDPNLPIAAGIPGELHLLFVPLADNRRWNFTIRGLDPAVHTRTRAFDPYTGEIRDLGRPEIVDGAWQFERRPPIMQHWVVVIDGDATGD